MTCTDCGRPIDGEPNPGLFGPLCTDCASPPAPEPTDDHEE